MPVRFDNGWAAGNIVATFGIANRKVLWYHGKSNWTNLREFSKCFSALVLFIRLNYNVIG